MKEAVGRRFARGAAPLGVAAALGCAGAGCFTDADGRQPVGTGFYFPTGLAVSPGKTTLYVANSDFDLRYAAGWVQALDLRTMRLLANAVPDRLAAGSSTTDACTAAGVGLNPDPWLNPGPCAAIDSSTAGRDGGPLVMSHSFVGAFSSGLLLVHAPNEQRARLFVPVRGDPSITYFEVEDDRNTDAAFSPSFLLDCQAGESGYCDDTHRLGQDREGTLRGIQLPADPVGIAATADGTAIVSAHQTQQAASLLVNDWTTVPELSFFTTGLPAGPTELATIPTPAFVPLAEQRATAGGAPFEYRRGFVLTFRSAAEIDVLRYQPDSGSVPSRPFLTRSDAVPITTNSEGFDSRGVAIVDSERKRCESACTGVAPADALDCNVACAENVPLKVYAANRAPPSLLVGRLDTITSFTGEGAAAVLAGAFETLFFFDTLPLNFGPSRVEAGLVVNESGELEDRVFAVAFDSRSIFVLDPVLERIEMVIRTGRGPHDIAVDAGIDEQGRTYSLLYVGHFTDSYIGVVDLDLRRPATYGQMIASIGTPTPPEESK